MIQARDPADLLLEEQLGMLLSDEVFTQDAQGHGSIAQRRLAGLGDGIPVEQPTDPKSRLTLVHVRLSTTSDAPEKPGASLRLGRRQG